MKYLILLSLFSTQLVMAHLIEGTPVLKGSLKTKVVVSGISTTCRVKVDEVKNLLEEDSFGNPAYKVDLKISLSGDDYDRRIYVRYDYKVQVANLFPQGRGTIVKDLEYVGKDGTILNIKADGRLKNVSFSYNSQLITCSF